MSETTTTIKDTQPCDSQWVLIRRRFARHRLAVVSLYVLILMYLMGLLCEFFAVALPNSRNLDFVYCPPQLPRISLEHGLYVYPVTKHVDPVTFAKTYVENRERVIPLTFFAVGESYKLWNLISCKRHFIGIAADVQQPATFFLLGADKYGRDIFSRIIYGGRISLSVGMVGIMAAFILGVSIGGVSGYLGGAVDNFIQRAIEIINSIPKLPLWLALGAVVPSDWSPLRIYFSITIVLSLLGWTGLARVVRGKLLALREEDYALAAYLMGSTHRRIIFRHLIPGLTSHIIVYLTMTIPWMILGETSLSFLGLGLRPPVVSWGVMLQDCMNMTSVAHYPWLLMPVFFIIATVLCFNFLGDGLRDAADPYAF